MTATIHPFPARMAPELALAALQAVPPGGIVIDPMAGSGTVLRHASDRGCLAIGFDMDPLAVLMSRVWTTPISDTAIERMYNATREIALAAAPDSIHLPWIDEDEETRSFIGYWFGRKQSDSLRCLVWALGHVENEATKADQAAADAIRIAISRIIITKEQAASLARDTSHSRPHRVTLSSDYCVFQGLERSVKMVRRRLSESPTNGGVTVKLGDARSLHIEDQVADAVLTSPPYLNAIDYMRGHRMSLVWLGYSLRSLRSIRSNSIGAERAPERADGDALIESGKLGNLDRLPARSRAMICRYASDVGAMAREIKRILKTGGQATLVVGNSCLKDVYIENSTIVSHAMEQAGMELTETTSRELPSQNRYLPTSLGSSLAKRMREEIILKFHTN